MIEVHGWIVIRESYSEAFEEFYDINLIIENLRLKIDSILKIYDNFVISLNYKNGQYQLSVFGSSNHNNHSSEVIYELLQWISIHAIGSYGKVYLYDDEDVVNANSFMVYCIKKGKIYKYIDPMFSPVILNIEE